MPTPSKRVNSPCTDDEAVWVVMHYGALRSLTAVRRSFGSHFKRRKNIPLKMSFKRVVERFQKTGNMRPAPPPGRTAIPENLVEKVRRNGGIVENPLRVLN